MTGPERRVCVVNPTAGGGRGDNAWPALSRQLDAAGLLHETVFTTCQGDGIVKTREALRAGASDIIAVGGDGTLHEVANGFFEDGRPLNPQAHMGILPCGSGSDLIKTLRIPKDAAGAIACLTREPARPTDLGRVTFVAHDGRNETRYFINTASAGLSGAVMQTMAGLPAFLKGAVRYNVASVVSFFTYRGCPVALHVDGALRADLATLMVVVGNGRYFGGGMHVLPEARIDDGQLDVVLIESRSLPVVLLNFPRIYTGSHLNLPMVHSAKGRHLTLGGATPLLMEIDGEQPGTTPASFDAVPGALLMVRPQ